ncbi:glycosyl hydrolase 53 family protein [Actinocrinis puniceicyclus]|uniref:Arabinogalactan endo-beta-1,4-galactanase n=1 Tax=Actinocrinis puniceicyclus TaxID=977794 RepID=A0A8J8BEF1_9ACTN|nr:glycosyl hydrolase 53 family protein [Actinocrinis puniceicyclus]MBS2963699.1 glycosyl hydrolase 53 family protein [Actinocrinis puniceicyclus]
MSELSISRRTLLRATTLGAGALTLGQLACARPAAAAAAFYKGADVSWVPQMEAQGYYWLDAGGVRRDILTILKGYGLSAIRLRTFVNPSSDPVNGHCSINETAAMAVRVRDAGMAVNIDYHFSDTWADEGHQYAPAAWANMSYSQMLSAMKSYVNSSMNVIKNAGVTPTWVQIGNEINSGICHPVGTSSIPAQMTGLLNAAYDEVKQVFPGAIVMIHLASPQRSSVPAFFSAYSSHGGKWDMNGFSSYGSADLAAGLVADMKSVSDAYGKPFMQVEVGGPASSPSGTETTVENYLTALVNSGGQGCLYWEPEVYSPFTGYGMGAWDSSTREPTAIMNAFTAVGGGGGGTTHVLLRNARTGLCIDGAGLTSNGANVEQWSETNSTNQQWSVESDGSYVRIRNRATGQYIDGAGATSNGAPAEQWSDTNSTNQQWTQVADGGNVRFRNRATGLYLDGLGNTANGSNLGQWADTGSTNQQWTAIAAS